MLNLTKHMDFTKFVTQTLSENNSNDHLQSAQNLSRQNSACGNLCLDNQRQVFWQLIDLSVQCVLAHKNWLFRFEDISRKCGCSYVVALFFGPPCILYLISQCLDIVHLKAHLADSSSFKSFHGLDKMCWKPNSLIF